MLNEPDGRSAAPASDAATPDCTIAGKAIDAAIDFAAIDKAKTESIVTLSVTKAADAPRIAAEAAEDPKIEPPIMRSPMEPPKQAGSAEKVLELAASAAEVPNAETPKLQGKKPLSPKFAPLNLDWIQQLMAEDRAPAPLAAAVPTADRESARGRKFPLLAVAVTIAAGLGALAGALGASGLAQPTPARPEAAVASKATADAHAIETTIVRLRADVAALKTSVEAATKAANGQFGKMAERFDRLERTRTEPPAWVSKTIEALERLERRSGASSSKEATGSVPAAPPIIPPAVASTPQPPVVAGWVVRDVQRGVALIQGPRFSLIEVEAGDVVPFLGRIESIRKQDGRWVVTTSKGIITASR